MSDFNTRVVDEFRANGGAVQSKAGAPAHPAWFHDRLVRAGADSVILGCTEITLLVGAEDSPVPVFDTTELHARAAVDAALAT